MPADRNHMPWRRGVGIMLLNPDGLVWTGRRCVVGDGTGLRIWQMPQGGIDAGERPLAAARRELKEETGSAKAVLLGQSRGWLRYDLPEEYLGYALKGKYRGQEQKWFAMRFTGSDADFDLDADTGHAEFDAWSWRPMETLPDLIVDFKRRVYEQVIAEFASLARPGH